MLPRRSISACSLAPRASALALALLLGAAHLPAQDHPHTTPPRSASSPHGLPNRPGGEHLSQWMQRHSNLPLPEQQRALEREPGFRDLSPEVQQRMHNRLTELNNMSPERRQRLINRTEAMERLAPEQRQQIRGTMLQLQSLPQPSRRAVSRAFRDFRSLPADQRSTALRSGQFTAGLSPEERATFNNLVSVEPYLPPPANGDAQPGQQRPPDAYGPALPPGTYQNGFQPNQPR